MSQNLRWLLALLPSLALAVCYVGLLRPMYRDQIDTANRQAADEERRLKQPLARRAADIGPRMTAAEQREAELAAQRTSLLQHWARSTARAESVQTLSRSFAEGGVLVERSAAESAETQDNRASPGARVLAQRMAAIGGDAPTLWRLDFRCTWPQLTRTFDRLAAAPVFTLPTGIHIMPVDGASDFEVSLWLWI